MSLGRADIEEMVDGVFELGSAAIYTPRDGTPVQVRACPRMVDVQSFDSIGLPALQQARVIELLHSEAGQRPVKGETIEVLPGGMALAGVYTVQEEATADDRYQLVWTCRVSEPE